MKRQYKERRLYFSEKCSNCGKPYQSFKRKRVKDGLCRKCRKNRPDPNQQPLFGIDPALAGADQTVVTKL